MFVVKLKIGMIQTSKKCLHSYQLSHWYIFTIEHE